MTPEQQQHYARQMGLPAIGVSGQQALLDAHVVIFGLGGLGSPLSLYLAAAGVGSLTLVDYDQVELSNLQRQIVHRRDSVNDYKVDSAQCTLHQLNPQTHIRTSRQVCLTQSDVQQLITDADVVADCTDNFDSRYLLNQTCHNLRIPLVSAAAIRLEGQITTFDFRHHPAPCYQCLYPKTDGVAETCATHGILAPVVGLMGTFQALEVVKLITGLPGLQNRLWLFNGADSSSREVRFQPDPQCPVCSIHAK